MSQISDEKLIKKAFHAHRNLRVLAGVGAAFIAMTLVWACILTFVGGIAGLKQSGPFLTLCLFVYGLIFAGNFMLAKAAKRGDPNAVTVPLMYTSMCLVFALFSKLYISNGMILGGMNLSNNIRFEQDVFMQVFVFFLIGLLVWAFWDCRSVLIKIKERELQEQIFGSHPPTRKLCVVGSILILLPLPIALIAGMVGSNTYQQQEDHKNQVLELVAIFDNEEQDVIQAFKNISASDVATLHHVSDQLAKLETQVDALCEKASTNAQFMPFLEQYKVAIEKWKDGCQTLTVYPMYKDQAVEKLNEGNRLRKQLGIDLTKKYSGTK